MTHSLDREEADAFWAWVRRNRHLIDGFRSPTDPFPDAMLQQLRHIDDGLGLEVSAPGREPRKLFITAGGDARRFALVEALVSCAPPIPGWQVVALKPPMGFGFGIRYEGIDLDPSIMWFQAIVDPKHPRVGLRVAVPGFDDDLAEPLGNGVTLILDTALGERSAATDIELLEICDLPDNPEDKDFFPLPDLMNYVAWRKNEAAKLG